MNQNPDFVKRKKARLRQQIVETALHLFRQRGYENTRIDDIVHTLEISQPTFFRYFPSKDAVLREVGRRAFARQAESLKAELSVKATTEQRLRRFYETLGNVTEVGATALAGCNSCRRDGPGSFARIARGGSRNRQLAP